jgi:putative acetyltransferase
MTGQGDAGRPPFAVPFTVRPEQARDAPFVHAVHRAAFGAEDEAHLVDRLRAGGWARVSLVAEAEGAVIGHILFSPVSIVGAEASCRGLGLAPMAVLPAHQRRGVGGALIREGLAACRREGVGFVVVIGHPGYYPRFGFRPAGAMRLTNEFGADDAFLVLELQAGSLPARGGLVRYGPEFDAWVERP